MDGRGGVIDIGNRARRRHRLQVAVIQAVLSHFLLQVLPILGGRGVDRRGVEKLLHLLGLRLELFRIVAVEEFAGSILGLREFREVLAALAGNLIGSAQRRIQHGRKVGIGEVQALFRAILDVLAAQVTMQVHLAQADGVGLVITTAHGRHGINGSLIRHGGQAADGGFHRIGEVRRIHGHRDIQGTQVAGNIAAQLLISQVRVEFGGGVDLQDFRAQVGHVDPRGLHRVRAVYGVLEHDVRVTGLELQLGHGLEEVAGVNLLLADAWVFHHLLIVLGDGDVTEGLAIDALDVIRREEVHIVIALSQLKGDIRHDDTQREGLNADLLIRVLALGIQEVHDVRVVRVEVDRAGTLAGTELIGVGEGILQQLHHGDDAGRLVLNVLNWCTGLADIRQQEGHAAAALGKLQRGVDGATDGLHIVLDAQQEAGNELAALGLAGVEEGRGSRLEATGHDLVYEVLGQACVAVCQEQGGHGHAVLKALEVAAAIKGLQRVAGVVLIRA